MKAPGVIYIYKIVLLKMSKVLAHCKNKLKIRNILKS